MFQICKDKAVFAYDINHLEQRGYKLAGQLMLWSVTQGGPGLSALCPSLFNAMLGKDVDLEDVDCIADQTTRSNLEKVSFFNRQKCLSDADVSCFCKVC